MKTTETKERLPDDQVQVKMSLCQKCQGWVTVAVAHMMDTKSKNEFLRDVMKYNLSVVEIPLLTFREEKRGTCACND